MLEDRGALPKEDKLCTKKTFSAVGCGRWSVGEEERKRVEGQRERVEIKRCLDRVSSEVFEDFSPMSEVESVGDSAGFFGVCALALPPSVPVVTVPFSIVNLLNRRPFLSLEKTQCVFCGKRKIFFR